MAGTFNKTIILGRLTRDPELQSSKQGKDFCTMTVATDKYNSDDTDFHKVIVFGKQAETCNTHLKKGCRVQVEGSISNNNYTDKNGNKQYGYTILAQHANIIDFANADERGAKRRRREREYDSRDDLGDAGSAPPIQSDGTPMVSDTEDVPF